MDNPYSSPSANLGGHESFGSESGGVTQGVVNQLARTKGWTRLCGVLAIILGALLVIASLVGGAFLGKIGEAFGGVPMVGGLVAFVVAIYLIMGGLYLTVGIKLNGFSSAVVRLIYSGREADLEDALDRQRSFWLLAGILSVVLLIFTIIGIATGGAEALDEVEAIESVE